MRCLRPRSPPVQILYNGQSVEVDGHSMRKLIADLQPNTEYSFVLMNRGSSAGGLQHLVSIRTAPDLLPHKPLPASAYVEDGRFTLTMPHVQDPALVRCADMSQGGGGRRVLREPPTHGCSSACLAPGGLRGLVHSGGCQATPTSQAWNPTLQEASVYMACSFQAGFQVVPRSQPPSCSPSV